MNILGISCYFHDAAAALLREGQLVAAAEEERFSRVKHDFDFPERAIRFCLDRAGLTAHDLDYVAFFEKPLIKFDRILQTVFATVPRSNGVFRAAMTGWLLDKLWVKTRIRAFLDIPDDRILFAEHHQSHAASAFFCSPFDDALILTVDGVGEWATATIGEGRANRLTLTHEIRFPHSLGLLYSAFTAFLGFEVNEGEYKVMGMAPYGVPRFQDEVRRLVRVGPDGSFALNLEYFTFQHSTTRTFGRTFEELFGPPRAPERPFFTETSGYPSYFGERPGNSHDLAAENQKYADLAARAAGDSGAALGAASRTGRSPRQCCSNEGANSPTSPSRHYPARFMLLVVPVLAQAQDRIPAVTHVDGSARVQTVVRETNPRYYALIERFGGATGVPVVLNTSFNLRGEPIVNTPSEALHTFVRSGMDALVLDRTIVFKT
jgi:predicted NodU family carbamoyl transferase